MCLSLSQSQADRPGTAGPTGIRLCGVPGADKGIAWRGTSDSGRDVCLSNSMMDTGVNAAVTPTLDCVCVSGSARSVSERTARLAFTPTEGRIKHARPDTSLLFVLVVIPLGFPFVIQDAYPARYKIGFSSGSTVRYVSVGRERKGSYRSMLGSTNQSATGVHLAGKAFHVWERGDSP